LFIYLTYVLAYVQAIGHKYEVRIIHKQGYGLIDGKGNGKAVFFAHEQRDTIISLLEIVKILCAIQFRSK